MPFEGFAECRLRFITDAQRRLADREVLFREQRVMAAAFEMERAAGHQSLRPAAAMLQQDDRIQFALKKATDRDWFRFRAVGEDVPVPTGNDHQIAARQRRRLPGAFHYEPCAAALDDVETDISVRRHAHCPGRGQLATTEDAPPRLEHIQHVRQRVGLLQTDRHSRIRSPSIQDDQTKNLASLTFTIPLSPVTVGARQSNAMSTTRDEYTCGASR
jgi:hypothetical protein